MDLPFALEGFFFEKVNGSTGQRVTFAFNYIIYAPASCHTAETAPFAWQAAESNSAPFAVLHVNDVCRWTWQLLLRGSFLKRRWVKRVNGSTGHFHFHYIIYDSRRRQAHATPLQKAHGVNGSTGQRVTFTFTILYMIADDVRLTRNPAAKSTRRMIFFFFSHTAYDDTRLTPHRCKKHTASFVGSTGKFPSIKKI